jgi:hypothetical protein
MDFKVNADCTALGSDMKTTIFLKENETRDTKDFYLPSLVSIATNGRSYTNKKGELVVEYSPSIDLDISKIDISGNSLNSFEEEKKKSKNDKINQVK